METKAPVESYEEAEKLCRALDARLRAAGVTLPSLRVDFAGSGLLIELGRCNIAMARQLIETLSDC